MKKSIILLPALALAVGLDACSTKASQTPQENNETIPTVYYIKDINPQNLVKIYEALGRPAHGKVGVKISSGESNKTNHLDTALINDLVRVVNGTFIECNTAYAGNRMDSEKHLQTALEHGYLGIDIMDYDSTAILPVNGGKHLQSDIVGKNFLNYDFIVVLSHFKGHQMAGFGGALKNISIGIASSEGKANIHSGGVTSDCSKLWENIAQQDTFLESMADACKAIIDHTGDNILYINVANNLSVDCDCNANPAAPEMADFGILASLDPVALDRACIDMVLNSNDHGKEHLIERINSRNGMHILDAAEELGLGSQKYNLVTISE